MKATGIVRRIDELGRVVIPKEIRRTLRIREGDPLELFTDRDELMLKKYSPIASIERFSEGTAKSLGELSGYLAVICDTDTVLHAHGSGKRALIGKTVSDKLTQIMQERRSYLANLSEGGDIVPITAEGDGNVTAQVIVPIVAGGDCLGAVAVLSQEEGAKMESFAVKLARLTADIIANQFES
ncbi:MAG: AbrB/MazE/SpoVT family DNA-binding domain-containing protein [Clostridia bacterium]|nr:AbrB/MazE/SpoVT family DNA-binding domain-containing protein [Clostridia bacterium]